MIDKIKILSIIAVGCIMSLFVMLYVSGHEVYAYSTDQEAISAASEYTDGYQYSVIIKWSNGDYQLFYGNSAFCARYLTENGTIRITSSGTYYNRWYSGGLYSSQYLTRNAWYVIDGSTTDIILYANHDVYKLSASDNSATTEIFYGSGGGGEWDGTYAYQYDTSIPNVEDMVIKLKAYFYIFDYAITLGNKTQYNVTWKSPEDVGLGLEIQLQSKFNNVPRRYRKQGYGDPWDEYNSEYKGEYVILPSDGKFMLDLNVVNKWMYRRLEENGIDTSILGIKSLAVPVTDLYFRYYSVDGNNHVIKYGNWTRLDIASGSQGIVEARYDFVTTEEVVDPDTGEVTYTDTEAEGNVTRYTDANGDALDESASYEGIAMSVEDALGNAMTGIKGIASWIGQVPQLITQMFSFLPSELITFLTVAIGFVIILRIAGR